jgi:hypothetical protein
MFQDINLIRFFFKLTSVTLQHLTDNIIMYNTNLNLLQNNLPDTKKCNTKEHNYDINNWQSSSNSVG